jgi:alpha-L-arabinofuranosidase
MFMNNTGNRLLETKKEGLDNQIILGNDYISGTIELEADRCSADFYDISVTDMISGEVKRFDNISFENGGSTLLDEINSRHYKVEFTARRNFGDTGFKLIFGKSDEKNFIQWFIGGWQNQDTEVNAQIKGRGSCLDHNIFSVMTGCEYKLCLEVNGREITTYINEKNANTAVDRQSVMQELYYTASSDSEKIYIKAVNIRDTAVSAQICVQSLEKISAAVTTLSGNELDDMNSFDNPTKVLPKSSQLSSAVNTFDYTFEPQSITVFAIEK